MILALSVTITAQPKGLDPAKLLDVYRHGQFDAALTQVAALDENQARALRIQLIRTGRSWVDADPADRPRRVLAAATFVLETERLNAERGNWIGDGYRGCGGACAIEWACSLMQERGPADAAEREWMLASVALASGMRDWPFLYQPLATPTARTILYGHLNEAMTRLPDEPRLKLTRAIALAARFIVADEMQTPREGQRTTTVVTNALESVGPAADRRRVQFDYVLQQFSDLIADPVVGAEARARLAYFRFRRGDYAGSLADAKAAADATPDNDLKYLARFIGAQTAQAMGTLALAQELYVAALEARPHSQSASVALAALQLLAGDADNAYDLIDATRERRLDDDPWRLFLYGTFPQLPPLLGQLRQRIG